MIQSGSYFREIVTLSGPSNLSRTVHDGDIVRVEVLDRRSDGTFRVRVAGVTLSAADIGSRSPGEVFTARIRLSSTSVFLHPLAPDAPVPQNLFAQLGIPETPVTGFLVAFFQSIRAKLDPASIKNLASIAARFPGKELRAAEAAALLAERGIEPSDAAVERLIRCMEGEGALSDDLGSTDDDVSADDDHGASDDRRNASGDGRGAADDGKSRDFLSFINMKKGHQFHWIVIPFRTELSGLPSAGSIRFLLDTESLRVHGTRVTCVIGNHDWDFDLTKNECILSAAPPFDAVISAKFSVYLKCLMERSGITSVNWRSDSLGPESLVSQVDVRV